MATSTGRSSGRSVLRPLSSSQRLHNHHHHQDHHNRQRSPSPCNLNLRLRYSTGNIPKPSITVSNPKRKCSCSPTTHPGSFRCAFHRRLEHERNKTTLGSSPPDRNNRGGGTTRHSGLYLRKVSLINSLAKIGNVEAERFRRCLAATIVKPSSLDIRRRSEFRPKPSRFFALHIKDQD